jgi:hypothetical protein
MPPLTCMWLTGLELFVTDGYVSDVDIVNNVFKFRFNEVTLSQ